MVSATTQLKLLASDGKRYLSDRLDYNGIIALGKEFPSKKANRLIEWFTFSNESIDGKSKIKAYELFESSFINNIEVGTSNGLQQIHAYLFGGLYHFARQIRQKNISKGDFQFAVSHFMGETLKQIEPMPETTFNEIANKYVEMSIAHPFMEGNGRSTRIWVDWSKISKSDYMNAMMLSPTNSSILKTLLNNALTTKINDREMFMKGIDYSYYYEENN